MASTSGRDDRAPPVGLPSRERPRPTTRRRRRGASASRAPPAAERAPARVERARSRLAGVDGPAGRLGGAASASRCWRVPAAVAPRQPHAFAFDETYYAKDAWSLLHFGYVTRPTSTATRPTTPILAGDHRRALEGRPVDGGAPRGRQVADRARREGLRDGPVRLADRLGRGRRADGAGDVPAGPRGSPARPLLGCVAGLLLASTGCTSCCPGWRCSTSSWRSSCSARCPAWSPTATGTAPGWPGSCPGRSPTAGTGGRCAACCCGRGCSPAASASGWRVGTKWTRDLPAGGVRAAGLVLERRRPARRSACAGRCCSRCSPTACPRSCSSSSSACVVYVATWTGWLMHAARLRAAPSSTQYTQYTGQGHCDDSRRLRQPDTTHVADRDRARRIGPGRG